MEGGEFRGGAILVVGTSLGYPNAITEAGFDVEQVSGVESALEHLEREPVDCVVCSHSPPETDGLDIVRRLRERRPGLPVVFCPADGSESLASEAIEADVSGYVPGTEATDRLVAAVGRSIERGRAHLSYREVFENVDVGLIVRDLDTGELLDVNGRYCEMLGYSREEALELDLEDVTGDVTGYDPGTVHELLDRAIADPSFTFEWPDRRKDGTVVWVEVDATVTSIEGRDRLLVTVKDVSDRRERERALETLHDAAARIQDCDTVEAACEATVEAASEVLDFEMCAVLVAEGEWLVPRGISAGAPAGGARRMQTDQGLAGLTFRSGESHLVEDVTNDADADPADESYRSGISVPVGEVAVFQAVAVEPGAFDEADVELAELLVAHTARALDRIRFESELRSQQTELRRQNERLEEFAGVVSHDLRNPLNVAQARLDIAREDVESADLAVVTDALSRMNAIIDDTLTLARQGQAEVEPEALDLVAFADRCWGLVETSGAELETGDSFTFRADSDRLRRLFENLFRNSVEHGSTSNRASPDGAVEHSSTNPRSQAREDSAERSSASSRTSSGDSVEHGSTGIRAESDDSIEHRSTGSRARFGDSGERGGDGDDPVTVRVGAIGREGFYVEDDGPGIPESERERVFEAGYTTASEGTGFGLAIVGEVVESHGWEVSVIDASSGGVRFEVTGVEPVE